MHFSKEEQGENSYAGVKVVSQCIDLVELWQNDNYFSEEVAK